jgi:hypothetical protein
VRIVVDDTVAQVVRDECNVPDWDFVIWEVLENTPVLELVTVILRVLIEDLEVVEVAETLLELETLDDSEEL